MNIIRNNYKPFYYLNQKRYLGNLVRGPLPTEIKKNFEYAKDFFCKRSYTYQDFKQRCESLRLFLYFGIVTLLSLDLIINPLQSSYWDKYSPLYLYRKCVSFFSNKQNDIFRHDGNLLYQKYIQLIN
ncbi:conserved Plasmodium protein, unknown function [Plasmodium sp. gorilla clade G2]|uniref:conserved Plasmodium protein, unknown function n=1 Tax=Plasmodium sp. gorilla clade G2 TaxID=880535 RepID=UPI000D208923|nr:conserved Plasmodium protein, unknown function [Plasmodium sp. gorilla clade G2]SOV10584.1 conserved Plasmodium protein, unknown function [Plasmodium sp. gorilla clade G2]